MVDMADQSILSVRKLSYSYGRSRVLDDLSLDVRAGEFLSIVGPNGAGKSTLLKCLNRILTGTTGTIAIRGRDLSTFSQRALAREIAYVPQAEGRFAEFTVFEFVLLSRYPHLSPFTTVSEANERAVWRALESTHTQKFAHRVHATLSGGERQKVFVAAALAQEAPILILDEATSSLDPRHQADILHVLKETNRQTGTTVLSVTHDINLAAAVSDRILAMKNGRSMFCGTPVEFMESRTLGEIYNTEFQFVSHPRSGVPLALPPFPVAGHPRADEKPPEAGPKKNGTQEHGDV